MIYKKNGYYVTRLKGEAEAYFKTRKEAEEYKKEYDIYQELLQAEE